MDAVSQAVQDRALSAVYSSTALFCAAVSISGVSVPSNSA
jgi:hypothetical protein